MKTESILTSFGEILEECIEGKTKWGIEYKKTCTLAETENPWFVKTFIDKMLSSWYKILNQENISKWLDNKEPTKKPKNIGVISAGNIPIVGLHDLISVLISGHNYIGKMSSKDSILPIFIRKIFIALNPEFEQKITMTNSRLENYDAIIATGSNNSSRYFEYYFNNVPNIIRKNRSSIAIINNQTTDNQIKKLADDIFLYFGLGCRNVSKIYIPENFELNKFFENLFHYNWVRNHNKYANNYEYNKAIYLMNLTKHYDNGFILLKEDSVF